MTPEEKTLESLVGYCRGRIDFGELLIADLGPEDGARVEIEPELQFYRDSIAAIGSLAARAELAEKRLAMAEKKILQLDVGRARNGRLQVFIDPDPNSDENGEWLQFDNLAVAMDEVMKREPPAALDAAIEEEGK